MSSSIEQVIVELSADPVNPVLNYRAGREYDLLGQTAAATGFYLRTAEYGAAWDNMHARNLVYMALLRISSCMDRQKDRAHTAKNSLQQAIAYAPERPEAYFLLAQHYERAGAWQDCYTTACTGEYLSLNSFLLPLEEDFGYEHNYVFAFERAVSAWWIGRKDEAIRTFEGLLKIKDLKPEYAEACRFNLERIK